MGGKGGKNSGNIIPMDAVLNNTAYKKLEGKLINAVKNGKDVSVDIKLIYENSSIKPTSIEYGYSINVEAQSIIFLNK